MKTESKIKVGQTLYDSFITNYIVSKVGNKYFECLNFRGRFSIDTLLEKSEYKRTQLYVEIQPLLDSKERAEIESTVRTIFKTYGKINLTLEQLRRINEIINEQA